MGFRVWVSGFRVWGLEVKVQGSMFRVLGLCLRVSGLPSGRLGVSGPAHVGGRGWELVFFLNLG